MLNQKQILRACIFIVYKCDELNKVRIYVNGRLWLDGLPIVEGLKSLFLGKFVIVDSWDYLEVCEDFDNLPKDYEELRVRYPKRVPKYDRSTSHGQLQHDPNKPHIKYFVWENDKGEVVYADTRERIEKELSKKTHPKSTNGTVVGSVNNSTPYDKIYKFHRDYGVNMGGVKCTEFDGRHGSLSDTINKKYKKINDRAIILE